MFPGCMFGWIRVQNTMAMHRTRQSRCDANLVCRSEPYVYNSTRSPCECCKNPARSVCGPIFEFTGEFLRNGPTSGGTNCRLRGFTPFTICLPLAKSSWHMEPRFQDCDTISRCVKLMWAVQNSLLDERCHCTRLVFNWSTAFPQ